VTLQRPTAINTAVYGNFSASKVQEIVVSHGTSIELLRVSAEGRVQSINTTELFAAVRSLVAFRLTGTLCVIDSLSMRKKVS
jgi:splicing factor 3B subunit 3